MKQRLVHILLTVLVFSYILFEELIWETIAKPVYDYLHRLRLLQKLEHTIDRFPAWVVLVLFLALFIAVEGVGLLAGVLALQGNIIVASLLYLSKIPFAAFAFWLFRISKEKLLTIDWFRSAYAFTMRQIEKIKASEIYRNIKLYTARIKHNIKEFKEKYLPKGELRRRAKRIYVQLKKIFRKDIS